MTVMTSRGCPYQCIFCQTPFGKEVRFHSPAYVVDYIDHLQRRFGVRELHFCDDTFSLREDRVAEICNGFLRRGLDLTWYAATRANVSDEGIFGTMRRAGCWICAIGVESGDPEVLRRIGKHIDLDQVRRTCRAVRRAGLMLKTFFILGSPGETEASIERTIRLAIDLKAHYPVFSLMTPFPGTRLWQEAERCGSFDRNDLARLLIAGSDPAFVPHGLTAERLLARQNEAFRRVYLTPGMIGRQLAAIRCAEDVVKLARAGLAFLRLH